MVESITAIPRRFGAWLALLALALQLGLSIGHVHKISLDRARAAGLSWAEPIVGPEYKGFPAGKPTAPADDQCPICFGLAVSGTFVLTAALCISLATFGTARLVAAPQPTVLARRHFSPAQQRARPPVAIPA